MGGGVSRSRYRMDEPDQIAVCETTSSNWLASRNTQLGLLKAEGFRSKTALGCGKFGVVFLSEHVKTQKYVAIKYISQQQIFSGKFASRIQQELTVLKLLDHPFIVHYFGCYQTPAAIGLVFAYTLGGELYTRIKECGKMSESEAKFYISGIALAVHYLHDSLKIVYRDLKPENILIDSNGYVKLCDFGFACPLSAYSVLSDGCGTAMYLAPEIASGYTDSTHGYPVDWWSLGCVLFELVTGDAPFGDTDTSSKFEILNNINSKTVRFPLFMSKPLKSLISGLLQRDSRKRFSWIDFQNCAFCEEINWQNLLEFKVQAPWKPPSSSCERPTTKHFLEWSDVTVPTQAVSSEVTDYVSSNLNMDNNYRPNSLKISNSATNYVFIPSPNNSQNSNQNNQNNNQIILNNQNQNQNHGTKINYAGLISGQLGTGSGSVRATVSYKGSGGNSSLKNSQNNSPKNSLKTNGNSNDNNNNNNTGSSTSSRANSPGHTHNGQTNNNNHNNHNANSTHNSAHNSNHNSTHNTHNNTNNHNNNGNSNSTPNILSARTLKGITTVGNNSARSDITHRHNRSMGDIKILTTAQTHTQSHTHTSTPITQSHLSTATTQIHTHTFPQALTPTHTHTHTHSHTHKKGSDPSVKIADRNSKKFNNRSFTEGMDNSGYRGSGVS